MPLTGPDIWNMDPAAASWQGMQAGIALGNAYNNRIKMEQQMETETLRQQQAREDMSMEQFKMDSLRREQANWEKDQQVLSPWLTKSPSERILESPPVPASERGWNAVLKTQTIDEKVAEAKARQNESKGLIEAARQYRDTRGTLLQSPSPEVRKLALKVPYLQPGTVPTFEQQTAMDNVLVEAGEIEQAEFERAVAAGGEPTVTTDSRTGKQIRTVKPPTKGPSPDSNERILKNMEDSKVALESAMNRYSSMQDTDPEKPKVREAVEKAQAKLQFWEGKGKGITTQVEMTDESGKKVTFTSGTGGISTPGTSGLTGDVQAGLKASGLQTKVDIKIADYESALEIVNDLQKSLSAGDVGIRGMLKEFSGRTLGQLDPKYVDDKTQMMRNKIRLLREYIVKEAPGTGRETASQRMELLKALPSTETLTSEPVVRRALEDTRTLLMSRARNYGATIGEVPLASMTPSQITDDYFYDSQAIENKRKAGLISKEEAERLLNKSMTVHRNAITRFWPPQTLTPK